VARILLVDDEEGVRGFLMRGLVMDGHSITTATNGGEALDTLVANRGDFDLLLTDIRMPVMDGIALALAAKRDFPKVVVILMTGYADQRERAKGLDAIVDGILTKPFSLAELKAAVAKALGAGHQ
jgi:two-component system, cell cycle response regulator CpdR